MFQGDHPDVRRTLGRGPAMARDLGHPRTGSEHLLLALSAADGTVSAALGRHGATEAAVLDAACGAAPLGAGAAADRDTLTRLGVDADRFLSRLSPAVLDRPVAREPLLPLAAARARRRCSRMNPPLRSGFVTEHDRIGEMIRTLPHILAARATSEAARELRALAEHVGLENFG